MKQPRFRELVATKVADINRPDLRMKEPLINHNKLLWRDASVDGVKTGFVKESGHCLVTSATRGDWQLIAVVLDSPEMYAETESLLDWAFSHYHQKVLARPGDALVQAAGRLRAAGLGARGVRVPTVRAGGAGDSGGCSVRAEHLPGVVCAGRIGAASGHGGTGGGRQGAWRRVRSWPARRPRSPTCGWRWYGCCEARGRWSAWPSRLESMQRLSKLIAAAGVTSRRKAADLVCAGRATLTSLDAHGPAPLPLAARERR